MRHGASLLASLEGISRPVLRIATELTNNSRSGLTVRFLAKKLEMSEEEIEYLLDMNHRLLFTDLTKVKIVSEGHNAIRRIHDGLENLGDIPSFIRRMKVLTPHDFRRVEELVDSPVPLTKKAAAELMLDMAYRHPSAIADFVAVRGFSENARNIFDIIWNSKEGIMPVSKIRAAHGGSEFTVEQGLWELFRSFAVFEMFRFDQEDRLVRVAGLLKEVRQWREANARMEGAVSRLRPIKSKVDSSQCRGLSLSDTICRLVAAVAARPARLRGDGELFREDRKRLADICAEEADPSLSTCLWVAEGAGWIVRVDNELRVGPMDALIKMDRIERHSALDAWFATTPDHASSRNLLISLLDEMRSGAWYSVTEVVQYALYSGAKHEQPTLKCTGSAWHYASPSAAGQHESRLARSLEESLFWLGIVDRGEYDGDSVFRISELGEALLLNSTGPRLTELFPPKQCEFVVQPNFDIVVPSQDVDPLLTVPLDQFAVRGSTGQATVYNVSKESFTEAVQNGHDANNFVEFLLAHNRGGALPTNVSMTLEDWRGAMKRVRIRTIQVIEADDPLVLADLLHRRKFTKYFAALDPKKAANITGVSREDLAKALEKDGFIVD